VQQPAISLDNVTKMFGRVVAVRGVTCDFAPARIHVLLGGNGAGKTTLLRLIAGLITPNSGSVSRKGTLGYMAHASMLYDELTALENMRYFAVLYRVRRDDCRKAIASVGLDPDDGRRIRDYSQGMRQRLSLARAILHSPDILLLDEPFSNVDARSTERIVELLRTQREAGKCVVVVTHQPTVLARAGDAFLFLEQGRLLDEKVAPVEVRL
jgi:ABC-type multidrug transport system ATPase subunit